MVSQCEQIRTILGLCARNRGHRVMYEQLASKIACYFSQQLCAKTLVDQAEMQGVAPLLYTHLSAAGQELPGSQQRILRSLFQRSRRANILRNRVAADILAAFDAQQIDSYLVKGIALANIIYDSPGLRSMRDIDLLLRKQDLERACSILAEYGFSTAPHHRIPEKYYHLPPMYKRVSGLPITIEIHHELLPQQSSYPVWTYENLCHAPQQLSIEGTNARTIDLETNLYYLYLHGLRAPLTYEPYRLIHAADLISLTERFWDRMDWDRVRTLFPGVNAVLSELHYISPWQDKFMEKLQIDKPRQPRRPPRPYRGWPQQKIKNTKPARWPRLFAETLYPCAWWIRVYYGCPDSLSYFRALLFEHPRNIWRWIKTYTQARWSNR